MQFQEKYAITTNINSHVASAFNKDIYNKNKQCFTPVLTVLRVIILYSSIFKSLFWCQNLIVQLSGDLFIICFQFMALSGQICIFLQSCWLN